jgi:hypothetical protein
LIKRIFIGIILMLCLDLSIFGQITNISADSVATILCHKWDAEGLYMGGHILPSEESVTYEFHKDNTFTRVSEKKTEKGTWVFEQENNWIHLKIKRKTHLYIRALKQDKIELTPDESYNAFSIVFVLKRATD